MTRRSSSLSLWPITAGQIRAIHAALSHRGIDDETYRAMLREHWQVDTCKALSRAQANALLNRLNGRRKPARRRQPIRKPHLPAPVRQAAGGNVVRLATRNQRDLIDALVSEIAWTDGGYEAWLRQSLALSGVRTHDDAMRTIEGLKGLKRHGHAR